MEISRRKRITFLFLALFSLLSISQPQSDSHNEKNIGAILDMGSHLGKALHICIDLALTDFYTLNSHYKTRIGLHTMDSNGDASHALSAIDYLLNKVNVQAILVLESSLDGKLLALFADKAKVPFFSFASIPSSTQKPYLFQISPDEIILFKGIASLVESYKLTNAVILYEDTNYASEAIPYLVQFFSEKSIVITYRSEISPSRSHDEISEKLDKVIAVGTTTVILHMSTSLASNILFHMKKSRVVNVEYTWIITDTAPDIIWKKEFERKYLTSQAREISVLGIHAYDGIWALAECVEKAMNITNSTNFWRDDIGMSSEKAKDKVSLDGPILANEISKIRFKGLSGEFQLINGKIVSKALEIFEVRGLEESRVGFWSMTDGIMKDLHSSSKIAYKYSKSGINVTSWSEPSTTTHNRKMLQATSNAKKLRIGVPSNTAFTEFVNVEQDLEANTTAYNGYCIDVFRAAMSTLPYDYELVTIENPNWTSYNDLIYQVYLQKYDGVVADITILANRSKFVDFTLPYTDLGVGTIERIDHKDMWIFFKPLGAYVWLTIAAFFAAVGSIVWLFEHPINKLFQGSAAQQIGKTLWFSFMTFFSERERLSSNWSKFIVIVWLFILLILNSSYTAILSSLLTVQQIQLASKGRFIGYQGGSFVLGVIINNMNFADDRLRPYSSTQDYADALSRGSKKGGVEAIVDEIPYLKIFLAQYSVGFGMIASESTTSGFGFAFQKGSPVVHDVSQEIVKLREDGTLKSLEKKWFKGSSYLTSPDSANTNPKILDFGDLSGLFLIGGVAFGLALGGYVYKLFQEKIHIVNNYILIIIAGGRLTMMMRYIYPKNYRGWAIS